MQIHELTAKQQLDEGLLDLAKKAAANITATPQQKAAGVATQAAAGLEKKGYGSQYQGASARWQDKLAELNSDPAATQYIRSVAQNWLNNRPLKEADNIQAAPSAGSPTPAEQAKLQQLIQQKIAQQTPTTPATDPYREQFRSWSDAQLLTRDPTSNKEIKMDDVRKQFPDLAERLNFSLEQIATARGTAQEAQAVVNYITLATAGVRALAQAQRNSAAQRGAGTVASHTGRLNATTDQMAELNKLAQRLGGVDNLIAAVKRSGRP